MYVNQVAPLLNQLKRFRLQAGLSQQALGRLAGISRQAYSAVESGAATPSTEVALRLARALKTNLDSLFSLVEDTPGEVQAELVGVADPVESSAMLNVPSRVQLMRVGHRLLARPLMGPAATRHSLVDAAGVVLARPGGDRRVTVQPFDALDLETDTLVLLGCDPAGVLLEAGLRRHGVRLVWSEEGSHQALAGLARGEAHVAGCHLLDDETGRYNVSWVQRLVPFPCTLITFAAWQQGLIVSPGNPKTIRGVEDLARPDIKIVNRQGGSGSRALLDRLLEQHDVEPAAVSGYQQEARGHLAVASAVASGLADAGVGVEAAATALELGFVPLEEERYDLVIPNHFLEQPGVLALLDLLRMPELHRRVETLGGYDVAAMGRPVSDG